jgi:hypothetical protein
MAVLTVVVDDLTGERSEDVKPRQFAIDGVTYEIDLSDENHAKMTSELADYIRVARKTTTTAPRSTKTAGRGPARTDREQLRAVREFARRNGYPISDRGRIPEGVMEAYNTPDETERVRKLQSLPGASLPVGVSQ